MMRKLIFFLCLIVVGIKTNAQTPNIILTKPVGGALTIRIALQTAGTVNVDWGNGTSNTLSVGTTQTIAGSTQLTGIVGASGSVKIYGSNIVWMNITSQALTGVDITNNPALRAIDMSTNSISSIDLGNNVALQTLGIHTNQLTNLDVSANINLTTLTCNNNQLTGLNVSTNTKLTGLTVSANSGLSSLDISNNVDLTTLRAAGIGLTSIDLSNNTKLNELNLRSNSLTSLDLSNNQLLGSTAAVNIGANSFSASALNQIFMDLPTLAPGSNRLLSIDLNSGAAASATSIAVAKNWAPNITGDGSSLPLTFLSFTGQLKNNVQKSVVLNWKTADEVNTKDFVIERAGETGDFKSIGSINAKNISGVNNYSYVDYNPLAGVSYYKLKQTDIDGKFKYNDVVVKVENDNGLTVNVYPIPAKEGKLFIQYPEVKSQNTLVTIYSTNGKEVFSSALQINSNSTSIGVSDLPVGNYILVYKSAHQSISKKIVIQ